MLIVYTTVFGNTKPLHEPQVTGSARFVCFTDQPIDSRHWEIRRVPTVRAPSRECRKLKQMSHTTFPDAEITLWMDSPFSLLVDPAEIARLYPHPIVAFRHRQRNRIRDEAGVIIEHRKGQPETILAQLAAYHADGFDTDDNPQPLISCGGFLLRRNTGEVNRFNQAWNHEVQTRSLRDQMSIDYCAWKTGVQINHFEGHHLDNRYAMFTRYKRATIDF